MAKGHTCLFDLQEKSTGIRQLAVFLIGVKHCLRDKQNFKEIIWNKTPKRNSSHNWTVKKHLKISCVWSLNVFLLVRHNMMVS